MAQQSFPFDTNGPAGSGGTANVLEGEWQRLLRALSTTGVVAFHRESGGGLEVTANGGAMAVSLATGLALVEGFVYRNDAAMTLDIGAADATNPRIDTVVVRLDRANNNAQAFVIQGTPAATPAAPALTQTDLLWEMPLADVRVAAAAGVINAGDVTNRRSYAKAVDAERLDGLNSSDFLRATGKAVDADKLDGIDSTGFLLVNGKAADSNLLDGLDSTAFAKLAGAAFTGNVSGPQVYVTFNATGTTAPASFPDGYSVTNFSSGDTGAPGGATYFVITLKHGGLSVLQLAIERDGTPEGDEPLYWRFGYSGGTPEWGAWQRVVRDGDTLGKGVTIAGANAPGAAFTGSSQRIATVNPTVEFDDTDNTGAGRRYWLHHNSGLFYLLQDRDGAGTWDSPHPWQVGTDGRMSLGFDPTADSHAATKRYADRMVPGAAAHAHLGADQSVANATVTILTFGAEAVDTHGFHDTATNAHRLTVPANMQGEYLVVGHVRYAQATGGSLRQARIVKNGTVFMAQANNAPGGNFVSVIVTTIMYLAAGDYIHLEAYQDSGGALAVQSGVHAGGLFLSRIGA